MSDRQVFGVWLSAIALSVCFSAFTSEALDHLQARDDAYVDCRVDLAVERLVADTCMSVVEQCRALVEGHACSCWRVSE